MPCRLYRSRSTKTRLRARNLPPAYWQLRPDLCELDLLFLVNQPGAKLTYCPRLVCSEIVRLLDFWQENVSKINPPHIWYRQQPASTNLISSDSSLYGCKLTLVMPDGTKRAFDTTVSYSTKLAACIDAFSQAWVSNAHVQAAQMREQVGWEAEEREVEEDRRERRKVLKGGEKPYEALKAEQERWMAPPIRATYEKDELSASMSSSVCHDCPEFTS